MGEVNGQVHAGITTGHVQSRIDATVQFTDEGFNSCRIIRVQDNVGPGFLGCLPPLLLNIKGNDGVQAVCLSCLNGNLAHDAGPNDGDGLA